MALAEPLRVSSSDIAPPDFRSLFNALPIPCIVLRPDDPAYTIVFSNKAYSRVSLTNPDAIVGRSLFEVFPDNPGDPHASGMHNLKASLGQVLSTKVAHTMATQKYDIRPLESQDAPFEERFWSAVNSPVLGEDGEVRFIIQRVEDITELVRLKRIEAEQGKLTGDLHIHADQLEAELFLRTRELAEVQRLTEKRTLAEQERRQTEELLRIFAESVTDVFWLTDYPQTQVLYVSPSVTAVSGLSEIAFDGDLQAWTRLIHPDDAGRVRREFEEQMPRGRFNVEYRLVRPDGEERWVNDRAVPVRGPEGRIYRVAGVAQDITARKRAEQQLRQQWQAFDTALSYTPDFAYTFDLAGCFTYVNRALLELWQKSLGEAYGKNFFELGYPSDLAARLQRQIQEVIETKQPLKDQTPFTGPSGEPRFYEYIFVPVLDSDGHVKAVAGSTRDITERNQAEEQIDQDRRRWRELLVQTPAGIGVLRGPEHRFEWINSYFASLVGRLPEAVTGKTVLEVLPEVEGQFYLGALNEVYRTGRPYRGHESLLRVDRGKGGLQDIYVNFVYLPTRNAAGAIDGIFVHVIEVTDLVIARKRIEASEERFRLAFQAVEGIVFDWDPRTGVVQRSGNLEKLIGIPIEKAEPTARWWQERIHPEDVAKSGLSRIHFFDGNRKHFEAECRVRHADGHWVYTSDHGYIIHDEQGAIVRVVGSTHDITEERTLLDALRQSEARFRQAIDSMPQLVWSTLPDGEPDLSNKQWLEYTGLPSGRTKGEEWNPVHPDDQPLARERWLHSLQTGEPFEFEFRYRRFDGQYRWFLTRATPIRDDEGHIVRWFGTSTDIEDRKRAESAVLTKQKLESLGLLAGGIAHDFNNLLVGVLGGASYAVGSLHETHPLQSILQGIVVAAERAAHLTRQMLAYAGKGRFLIESIYIGELVQSTYGLIKGSIPNHVHVTLDIRDNLPPVEADSGQMQQIVMNLILNAAEAIDHPRPGTVAVRTTMLDLDPAAISRIETVAGILIPGSYVVLDVQDNGSGMDHDTQTKIFDPFFTTKFTGRGLGLSAVQGILRTHNGALELHSRAGKGSTFRVFLPASGKEVLTRPGRSERLFRAAGTVLIVDDEEIVLKTTKAILERAGLTVLLAANGESGIRRLLDRSAPPISLIILDMGMPGMNGKDVMEKIRALGIRVPVLICSGYSEAEVFREFSGLDIAGFIQKPFTPTQLIASIRDAFPEGEKLLEKRTTI